MLSNTTSTRSLRTLRVATAALAALAVGEAAAASGPQYRSLRAQSMGNAFVAVVDNKDALYYNPAGLNLINSLGNASARPGLAAYPRTRLNARVNIVGAAAPLSEMNDFFDLFKKHRGAFRGGDSAFRAGGNDLINDLNPYDRRAIEVGVLHGAEFAMHNYGAAYWLDARVAPYADVGVLLPQAGIETIQLDAVIQVAAARGFLNNRLAAGGGYRLANRQTVHDFQVATSEFAEDGGQPVIDRVQDTLDAKFSNMNDFSTYGHGIDLGALWQQTSWLRFGAAFQNLGMHLDNEFVTPELTVGAAVTPPLLSTGGKFPRKVNLAVDFEDILNDERNYKLMSKVNFGAEVEQYLWWFASARVAGGFKGGYWSAGAGLSLFTAVHIEAASWAEEAGFYTGHIEDRYWAFRVGVGL
jgi:hypothetical protein